MPCDSQILMETVFGSNTNADAMLDGLKILGLYPNRSGAIIYFQGGYYHTGTNKLVLQGSDAESRTKEVKRAYMTAATQREAKRVGFQVKVDAKDKFKFQLVKRSI